MNYTKEHIKLAELLAKELAGELTENEKKQLNLFESNDATKEIVNSVRQKPIDFDRISQYQQFNIDEARKKVAWRIKFQQRNKTRKLTQFLKYAAVIALPLAMAIYMVFEVVNTEQNYVSEVPVEIKAGETKAQLYLSDGRTVDLESKKSDLIQEIDGSVIEKGEEGLNYQSNQDIIDKGQIAENIVVTPVGGEYQLTLSDGTKVWMNAKSEIRYPVRFSENTRKVKVSGEIFFEVAKDLKKPFVVDVNDVEIRVLGTQFNVMAYPDERSIQTTLVEGAVRLRSNGLSGKTTSVDLIPGKQADYDRFSKSVETKDVDVDQYIAWKNGKFVFEKETLEDIMRKLERWYDVKVFFQTHELKQKRFSSRIDRYGNINDILEKMEQTTNVQFVIKNNIIQIREK